MPPPDPLHPMLAIALIFAAGYPMGLLARKIGFPAVTGNILAGVALGPSLLGVFERSIAHSLEPVTVFALGMVTVVVGGHLSYRRLHNAKRRIVAVTLIEVALPVILVTAATWAILKDFKIALLMAAIAAGGAPATVLAVVREERAKGILVKTLLASVALDNVLCVVLFSFALSLVTPAAEAGEVSLPALLASPVMNLGLSAALGFIIAAALLVLVRRRRIEPFSGLFMAIVTTIGLAEAVGLQSLLASLTLGVVLGNAGREGEEMIDSLENLEPLLLTCFFTLAGVDLDLSRLLEVGLLGGAYFAARAVGKVAGGAIGAAIGSESPRIRRNLGPALLPQAGLAIGMVVILQGNANIASELKLTITNVVLAAVVLNEILGPPLVRRAIHRAGEAGKDRRRVVEFLQEENIRTPMRASDRWDAIRQLAEFLVRSHDLKHIKVAELVRTIEEREREFTTALGMGVALPHARVPRGPEIMGVMGIFPEGVDFGAADGEPARVVILIATPEGREDHHLEVMAAVTRIVSDAGVRARLFAARTSADAFEAIEMDLEHDYNYFLEEA